MLARVLMFIIFIPFVEWQALKRVYHFLKPTWGSSMAIQIIVLSLLIIAFFSMKILKKQGARILNDLKSGESLSDAALDAGVLVISGVLFLIPGYISDLIALMTLLPPGRKIAKKWINKRMQARHSRQGFQFFYSSGGPFTAKHQPHKRTVTKQQLDNVIDVDAVES